MGIGKWNAERVIDKNTDGVLRKVVIHVEEGIGYTDWQALKARASDPYTQSDFDTYLSNIIGDWWDDVPSAVRARLRDTFGLD
jgi:hypothetical protein